VTWATASAVEQVADGRYRAQVDPRWTVAGRANGGYLLGMAARAAAEATGRSDVLSASAIYLDSPDSDTVEMTVEPLRAGRSVSHARVRL
jgi:acyl-CoA thioesterase